MRLAVLKQMIDDLELELDAREIDFERRSPTECRFIVHCNNGTDFGFVCSEGDGWRMVMWADFDRNFHKTPKAAALHWLMTMAEAISPLSKLGH